MSYNNDEQRQDEHYARIQLTHLIQARDNDESLSAPEQTHQVDTLLKIVEKHGEVLTLPSTSGMLPLHEAVENGVPLEMIQILATAYPNAVTIKYPVMDEPK